DVIYHFFARDYQNLLLDIEALEQRERQLRAEFEALDMSSTDLDGLGDGGTSDKIDSARDHANVCTQLDTHKTWRNSANIVEPTQDISLLRIGHIATIQRYADPEGTKRIGTPERYFVGSYRSTDMSDKKLPTLSYDSPLLERLLGKSVDPDRDPAPIRIGGKTIYVELTKIEAASVARFRAANANAA
ncbi:MAG: hypothetical protein JWL88_126, partial [Parcubacteria group bacterium]|nr:hypothetical protein [Parcubacteria group bacterium]